MMSNLSITRLFHAGFASLAASAALAQTVVFEETRTLGAAAAPIEREIELFDASTLEVTLTDLAVPAAIGSPELAIIRDAEVVVSLEGAGKVRFAATPGRYAVRVTGIPDAATGIGTIGVRIADVASSAIVSEFSDTLTRSGTASPPNRQILDTQFEVTSAGAHEVVLNDPAFPAALSTLNLAITRPGASTITAQLGAAGTASFNATPGTYRLFVIAEAAQNVGAGAFTVVVSELASGTNVLGRTLGVGATERLAVVDVQAAQHSLVLTDLALPTALARAGVLIARGGTIVARADNPSSTSFTPAAGLVEVLGQGAAAGGAAGSYAVELRRGATSVYADVRTASSGSLSAYVFQEAVPAAGTYRLQVADLQFPRALTNLQAVITQGAASLASLNAAGTTDATLAAGPVFVLLFATPAVPAQGVAAGGIVGVELRASAAGSAALLELTQGVGALFSSRKVTLTVNGTYDARVDDIEFPARFGELAVVVSRGSEKLGSVIGEGTFPFDASAGNYFINFIATPAQGAGFGSYRLRVATRPSAPTVSLTAAAAQVTNGTPASLSWSATNASTCTADGAWSGAKALSGSETTTPITTSATFRLTCNGPGGQAAAEVNVTPTAATNDGGGGAFGLVTLLGLLAAALRASRCNAART